MSEPLRSVLSVPKWVLVERSARGWACVVASIVICLWLMFDLGCLIFGFEDVNQESEGEIELRKQKIMSVIG